MASSSDMVTATLGRILASPWSRHTLAAQTLILRMMSRAPPKTLCKVGNALQERSTMVVHTTRGDVKFVLPAAMKSSIVGIVTMTQRVSMRRMIHNATRLIGASWKRLSVPCAITSKMCNKFVKIVASVWASIFAPSASSLTMIIGGRDNFFHCDRCGCCYSVELRERHTCVEKSMHQDCAICMEYLFDSLMDITVLPCGHTLHLECLQEMYKHYQYNCPLCNKSVCDMSSVWKEIDLEIASIQMPENQSRMVWILCNDCGAKNEVRYHVVGQKCGTCPSYNTRLTESPASRTPS
ncbi:zinc finger protein BRUTUS-like At1g18910 isoform X4 [Physcomitrium patens]|uniref:RING-type domain-containing protein n=1 Tax=Physcomitrium patens TaxID=3218 RepID=A0A7I4ART2_PHYPA|nr:zinc finger protein BRUTUS-like At1g18910 isoform X4 [Physcomitrium patens]|eukprot:XP_024394323.1 zinc finger protein BRUTUS-like At1g18910 isoform X4 [Physcomitrella patens]